MYKVLWDSAALDDLKQLDKGAARKIVDKVSSYLVLDPINLGKLLSSDLSGLRRYRFGDYRVVYEINRDENMIVIVRIGHRKDVYQ